jgi:molybdenum cofactor biosynthesis enzyme MoaA
MLNYKYDSNNNKFDIIENQNVLTLPQIIWHIIDFCPLKCPYCFSTKDNPPIKICEINSYINIFKKLGVQKIDISGGEPLQYKYLSTIIDKLYDSSIYFTLTSSGCGLIENINYLINNASKFSRLIFSIDGPDPNTHDALRGKDGLFNSLLSIISVIKKEHRNKIRINTVITKLFLEQDYCTKMVETINGINPAEWCLIQPHPANKKNNYEEYSVSLLEFQGIIGIIKGMNVSSQVKVLTRYADNYSNYWVLYPNRVIKKHTENALDKYEIPFIDENIGSILDEVSSNNLWLPTK